MLRSYLPILVQLILVSLVGFAIIALSYLVGKHKPTPEKLMPYECGVRPTGGAHERFPVKFYLVAMLFILFDVEVVFLYPWAVIYRELLFFGFFEMLTFILVVLAGYVYIWKKGALDWNKN
ncbi:MAG: NADH-quinone oxidoreductase subunit A [Acidobacteriia bacterium]|nr:NADH-quinone oxidoreductase subunit A [Terriglobia bacterium]